MARYVFICDECNNSIEVVKSMKEGPPKGARCECGSPMYLDLSCNFILKGDGWPGKDLNKRKFESDKAFEETKEMIKADDRAQRIVNEVGAIRRKGRKATNECKKDHPEKFKEYTKALAKGYRGKRHGNKKGKS